MINSDHYTDGQLLELLHQDDEGAFKEIYRRYWKILFNTAYSILHEASISEDVAQEVFISLWNRRQEAEISSLAAYLNQATRYQVYKAIRSRRVDVKFYKRLAEVTADLLVSNPLLFKEQQHIINQLLESLPEDCKEVFRLSRFEDKTYKEIAALLNITEKTVEYRISRALKHIRKGLTFSVIMLAIHYAKQLHDSMGMLGRWH